MRKRDAAMLFGGTVTGMGVVLNVLSLAMMKENFIRRSPKLPKPGKIDSVDEMHIDYLRRKALTWIDAQPSEEIDIKARDGVTLRGKYIHNSDVDRADGEAIKVVILSHGYGGTGYKDMLIFTDYYRKQGFDIVVIDQRAHGKSGGNSITFGAKEQGDMIRWVRAVMSLAGDNCQILLHGWSMGAAIAYLAAAEGLPPEVKGIVYDCGYSVAEAQFFYTAKQIINLPKCLLWYIIQAMKPWCKLLLGFDMDEAAPLFVAKNMKLPIFFVHGDSDTCVPLWMGHKLYEATDRTKYRDMLVVAGADHTYSYNRGKAEYEAGITRLINSCMD